MQIYKLVFTSGKTYVGQTTLNHIDRFNQHKYLLSRNKHHSNKMQMEYNKYGVPIIFLLEDNILHLNTLNAREKYWIFKLDTYNSGLNHTLGGDGVGYGASSPGAKYTEDDYLAVISFIAYTDMSLKDISEELNINYSVVNNIASGYTHGYLANECPEIYSIAMSKIGTRTKKIHTDQIYYNVLCAIAYSDLTYDNIANMLDINKSIVGHIASGSRHNYLKELYPIEYQDMLNRDRKHIKKGGSRGGKEYAIIKSPEGNLYKPTNILQFCKEHSLDAGSLNRLVHGKQKSHKGWVRA